MRKVLALSLEFNLSVDEGFVSMALVSPPRPDPRRFVRCPAPVAEKCQVYVVGRLQADVRPSSEAGVGPAGCQGRRAGESSARGCCEQDRRDKGRSQKASGRPPLRWRVVDGCRVVERTAPFEGISERLKRWTGGRLRTRKRNGIMHSTCTASVQQTKREQGIIKTHMHT